MNWSVIQTLKGKDAFCTLKGKKTRIKITDVNEFDKGSKWISLSFYENHELTPKVYGAHLGNCNVLYSPKNNRDMYGWHSAEIIESMELCCDLQG